MKTVLEKRLNEKREDVAMKRSVRSLVIGLTVLAFTLTAGYVFSEEQKANPSPPSTPAVQKPPHEGMMGFTGKHPKKMQKHSCLGTLQLDEKQREELRKIYQSHRAEINNMWTTQDEKLSALEAAIKGGDEQAIRKAFQDLSKVRENMLVMRLSILKEIKNILTDAQKSQLDACIQQRLDRFHKRWEGELMRFLND